MTSLLRTPAISSSGISAQLVRLLPPLGCPGQPVWVPPNEVLRWEQLGFYRAPIPAAVLELAWQPVAATAAIDVEHQPIRIGHRPSPHSTPHTPESPSAAR